MVGYYQLFRSKVWVDTIHGGELVFRHSEPKKGEEYTLVQYRGFSGSIIWCSQNFKCFLILFHGIPGKKTKIKSKNIKSNLNCSVLDKLNTDICLILTKH